MMMSQADSEMVEKEGKRKQKVNNHWFMLHGPMYVD